VQLEILVGELVTALPGNKTDYDKLLGAAADLHATRAGYLSDQQLATLGTAFDQAVGADWCARLPDTGVLLGCAVADELAGCPGAVISLQPWLTDADRFPPEWIAAVAATLAQARRMADPARPAA
jgi:phage tail sheath gpL-like